MEGHIPTPNTNTASKTSWHDWVGELFKPAFGATIEDLVAHEEEPKNKPRVKHISVHDPEAVQQVYQRVHMMTVLDEEMRKQRREQGAKSVLKTADKAGHHPELKPVSVETEKRPGQVTVDLNESCIWDSNEISVLREAYKSLKQQSIDAMVYHRETKKRNEELEALTSQQKQTIDIQRRKLKDALKANKRLQINVNSLNEEVKYLTAKVGAMEEVIREMKIEQADMVKELHENRVSTDRERMERGRVQMKLDNLQREAIAEKLAAEDKIRTQCRKAIHDLKEEVKQLEKELKEERKDRKSVV